MKRTTRETGLTRLDIHMPKKLKALAEKLARDQGCASVSEYVRILLRADAERRGFKLPEKYPVRA